MCSDDYLNKDDFDGLVVYLRWNAYGRLVSWSCLFETFTKRGGYSVKMDFRGLSYESMKPD
jgi:hypothetical protein